MPRANLSKHMDTQAKWDESLLQHPKSQELAASIEARIGNGSSIHLSELGALLNVPPPSLRKQVERNVIPSDPSCKTKVPRESALLAIKGYIPRILGWKPVADFAKEVELHRNSVESIVKISGTPEMLRLALDQKLYISPEGEALVSEKKKWWDSLEQRERLIDIANRYNVESNVLTAFFSGRKITLDTDRHGNARLTEEQKQLVLATRERALARQQQADLTIDGTPYRSILRVAEERVAMFAPTGSERYAQMVLREERVLRYFADKGGFLHNEGAGLYLPRGKAEIHLSSIAPVEAQRLLGISRPALRHWCDAQPGLVLEDLPGKRSGTLDLNALLELARVKFNSECHLHQRPDVPTILASLAVHRLALQLGASFSSVARLLPVTPDVHQTLEGRIGVIPREAYQEISKILRAKELFNHTSSLTSSVLEAARRNAPKIGLTAAEVAPLVLPQALADQCQSDQLPIQIPSQAYLTLIKIACVDPVRFTEVPILSASTMRKILSAWSTREGISLELACKKAQIDPTAKQQLVRSSGELTGKTLLQLLTFVRMDRTSLMQKGLVAPAASHAPVKTTAAAAVPSQQKTLESLKTPSTRPASFPKPHKGPILREVSEVTALMENQKGPTPKDLDNIRLTSALLQTLIERTATARNKSPENVFTFVQDFFKPTNDWTRTLGELCENAKEARNGHLYMADVGIFLCTISDPGVRVHIYAKGDSRPRAGDLLVHPNMRDYGFVTALENQEGGLVARVALTALQETVSLRVL